MFFETHILQNFAPSNLNRDDTGAPKDCTFGGVRRARISSQCLKRAIRRHFGEAKLFPADLLAVRTKRVVEAIADRLAQDGRDREAATRAVTALLAASKLKVVKDEKSDDQKTQYLLYLASNEIARMTELSRRHWDALTAIPGERENGNKAKGKDGKKTKQDEKKDARAALPQEIQEAVDEALGSGKAVDLALFGRMLADASEKNVEAACQVAHAISVNEVSMEMDFYTAVDDLKPSDTQGADMMGVVEFNSSCFYRYAKLDLDLLKENLKGDASLSNDAAVAFVRSAIAAVPTGKQNSMAAHNPPSYVRVLLRREGEPWNLANAFLRPVRVKRNGEEDLCQLAAGALDAHLGGLRRMYGGDGIAGDFLASLYAERSLTVADLLAQLRSALA